MTQGDVAPKRHRASISETAAFVTCSCADVVKVFKDWTEIRKTGSELVGCGRQRLVKKKSGKTDIGEHKDNSESN